ncbi:protein bfr2 [Hyposmocoma kahamanoa]|uniref:protein bfr2 n=1 Tax=Hyposmocoma kahamanoa TaxID=1477025 RepID=UPI000E6D9E58|nr:protein bfr2 [Hyposmocoma kahamanoa]
MRKRKSLKKDEDSEGSEPAGEPEEFQDSGEDWTPDADSNEQPVRGSGGRKRTSKAAMNNSNKKKRKEESSEDSEGEGEDDEEAEDEEGDLDEEEGSDDEKNGSDGNKSDSSQSKDVPKHFHSGNFVLLKSDVKWDGDTVISKLDELNLWKIDGKALLQKFIPMESNGKILHKCTCVYSGWNVDNRDNYYPITEILDRNPRTDSKEICVALDLDDLIKVRDK